MVYGHANGSTVDETITAVKRYADLGYEAVRAQCAVPGLAATYGVGRGELLLRAGRAGRCRRKRRGAANATWHSCRRCSSACGASSAPTLHLLHDVHHRLTPIEAGRLGKSLEPYHLFWLEDPTPAEVQDSFRTIRQHTTTPIAVGEVFNTIYDCQQLIEEELIDYIRTTVVHAGGISHLRKIAALAELHHVRTGSHGATDLSPVCMAAALHFDLSVHNFGIQEYMRHTDETDLVFPHAYTFERGFMHPGRQAGPRRRSRRDARRDVPVSARVSAGEPEDRWDDA